MAFFSNFIKLTPASSGATRISGTQGDLTTWSDWALPQAGWTALFSGTNRRIWQAPSGNRCPVLIDDNTAISGDARLTTIRGCESASGINTLVDAFPQVAQVADNACNILKSSVASTLARDWFAYVFDWGFYLAINVDGIAENYPLVGYTDTVERLTSAGDVWGTVLFTRNTTSAALGHGFNGMSGGSIGSSGISVSAMDNLFQMRNATGAIKSSRASLNIFGNVGFGNPGVTAGMPIILSGPGNSIDMIQAAVSDAASGTANTLGSAICINRGYLPNMRVPVHSALTGVSQVGDFEQSSHDPLARFRLFKGTSLGGIIIEETNTWLGTSTG